ncbi:MAG TPA: trigger factor [Chromatiaceae bacterium]|nr:trigger factor [Chromatiaceae bacterium]
MQVSVESGEGLERRITVDLSAEQFEAEVAKRLQQVARTARLAGFRPGKVPVKILRQRFGTQVRGEAFGDLVQSSFAEAVAQQNLLLAGAPQIMPNIDDAGKHYGYTATFDILPTFELRSIAEAVIRRPVAEVGDADLAAMLDRLRQQRKTWTPVDRPAENGDRLRASFTGTVDGEVVAGASAQDRTVELGAGRLIPGFEEGLVGISAGESRTLDLTFPEGYQAPQLAGKPVTFQVAVSAVEAPVLPEIDAELARAYGVADGDVERFRADVRANMQRELRNRIQGRIKNQVMDAILAANPIPVPGTLVRQEIGALREQTRQNAGATDMQLPDVLFEESAKRRVALGLIIAEVVKRNHIVVDRNRVRAAVEEMAATYEDPAEVMDHCYASKERLAPFETMVLEDQVVDWALGQARVEDEPMSFKDLTEAAL